MSRLASLSPAALAAMFSPDADKTLITLLTVTGAGIATPVRLADHYLQRISETDDEVLYGVVSNGNNFIFLPFQITLPQEEQAAVPRCRITLHDVTRYLIPQLRTITSAPSVQVDLVLNSAPNTIEVSFGSFLMGGISYDAGSINADLTVESLATEPFPAHTFTPGYFPGLF